MIVYLLNNTFFFSVYGMGFANLGMGMGMEIH